MVRLVGTIGLTTLALVGGAFGSAFASSDGRTPASELPVAGPITQPFGCTALLLEPFALNCPQKHFHSGVDVAAPLGTPVRATFGGTATVIDVTWGYGLHVLVDQSGTQAVYGHLSKVLVSSGDQIETGQVVGLVGTSGTSTGPHLHFEIRVNGVPQDPLTFLNLSPTNQPNT